MTFEELADQIKNGPCEEVRTQTESFLEVVVGTAFLGTVSGMLEAYFGSPMKAEGKKPDRESSRYAEPYGGIRQNQTLYRKKEGGPATAILWPWGSGSRVTLKLIKES